MASTNPFEKMEERLKELVNQLAAGSNYDEFKKEIQTLTLTFNDEVWQLGVAGKWGKLVKGMWIPAAPPTEDEIATASAAEEKVTPVESEENEPTVSDAVETEASEDEPITETTVKEREVAPNEPRGGAAVNLDTVETETSSVLDTGEVERSQKEPSDTSGETPPESKILSRVLIIGGIIAILLLCFFGGWIWLNQSQPATPTPVAQPSVTRTLAPTTNISTETATPSDTPTPTLTDAPPPTETPVPSDTPTSLPPNTPTSTLTPTETPTPPPDTPTSSPTSTITPTPTLSPTPDQSEPSPPPDTFSPAGLLAYPVFDPDPQRETYDVYIVRLETGETVRVIKNASQPDLSSDGKQIVYRSWQSDRRKLIVENLDGGIIPWYPSTLFEASRPIWNANGGDIVFAVNNIAPDQWDISFSGDRRGFSGGITPAWFQDGRIIYQGSIGIENGLIMTDPNQGGPVFLTYSPQDTAPAPSPDGSKVAFISNREGDWDLYLVEVATKEVKRLTNDPAFDTSPIWSPNGTRIAFASTRGGSWAVWAITPEGIGAQQLLNIPGPFEGKVADAPDAQQTSWQTEHISWVQ